MKINVEYLKQQRIAKGMSQEALATKLGYKSKNAWQRIEKGHVQVQSRYLMKLIDILELDLNILYIED